MKFIPLFICLLFICFNSKAQKNELAINEKFGNYGYQTLGRNGILVHYDLPTEDKKILTVTFIHYDTNMVEVTKKSVKTLRNLTRVKEFYSEANHTMYLCYNRLSNYKILSFNFITQETKSIDGKLPGDLYINEFKVFHNAAYTITFEKEWAKINLEDGTAKRVELNDAESLVEFPEYNSASIISWKKFGEGWGFSVRNFGEGIENKNSEIIPVNTNNLTSVSMSRVSLDVKFFAGTYTTKLSPDADKNFLKRNDYEDPYFISLEGFYLSKMENNQIAFTRFVPYSKINFNINNKTKRNEGDTVSFYTASVKQTLKVNNTYIIAADILKKIYVFTKFTDWHEGHTDVYYRMIEKKVKAEYSLVMGFDKSGNLLWRDSVLTNENSSIELSPDDKNYRLYTYSELSHALQCNLITESGLKKVPLNLGKVFTSLDEDDNYNYSYRYWFRNTVLYKIRSKVGLRLVRDSF